MIKKAILILTLPTLVFIYLESCNKPCEHPETRTITGISLSYDSDSSLIRNRLNLDIDYESYFVQNYQFNLTNKSYALSQVHDPCFNKLINPIGSVSIKSKNDFFSTHPANTELNNLFIVYNMSSIKMDKFKYDVTIEDEYSFPGTEFMTRFQFSNDTIPTLDSIHDLCITVYCGNGDIFKDSLIGINLKSKL